MKAVPAVRTLSRRELTVALAARQMLLSRSRASPAEAIRRLTPLQGQHAPAPYLALAARVEGFAREQLETALADGSVVKSTLMRLTLHLAAAADYPAYHELARQARMRTWRNRYAHLDEGEVAASLAAWLREPRTNDDIRERVGRYGVPSEGWEPVIFARTLLPLVQLPPAGFWNDRRRPRFVVHPGPYPDPAAAATVVLRRYLAAFGPATRRDMAAWAGVAQRDFTEALAQVRTVSYRGERDAELLDLPDQPLPPASTRLPVRLLANWDQPLLAYAQRERILPAELAHLQLTQNGKPTVTVDGRVAATWSLERDVARARVSVTPLVEISRAARREIREEAKRVALVCEPDARRVSIRGV